MDRVILTLTVEADEDAMEFVQEWATAYAREIRTGLSEFEFDADILLTTSDGVCETH